MYRQANPPVHDRVHTPAHPPDYIRAWASTEHDPFDPEDKDPDELLYPDHPYPDTNYDQYNPPPPPHVPPPARRTTSDLLSKHDGLITSPGSYKRRHDNDSTFGPDRANSHHQYESPVKLKSERSYDRKRSRDQKDDDSDDEQKKERRRQHDDVTPKLKRRQPKVAEAYRYVNRSPPLVRMLISVFKLQSSMVRLGTSPIKVRQMSSFIGCLSLLFKCVRVC